MNPRTNWTQNSSVFVVKVGSRILTNASGQLDDSFVADLSKQLADLRAMGKQVVLVSSGAVASGMGKMGLNERPTDLASLQALAAIGQASLVQAYEKSIQSHGHSVAQLLLTATELRDRKCYLNVRNTLQRLLDWNTIPVINENDSVAVDELQTTFGDNDQLAASVTTLLDRVCLIILSDVAGLYDRNPTDDQAKLISHVEKVDQAILNLASGTTSAVSKGGMLSKLKVAQSLSLSGTPVFIAQGRTPDVIARIVDGDEIGTFFQPAEKRVASRKRWIGFGVQPFGRLQVDQGAVAAMTIEQRSLLSIGIQVVHGDFDKGDLVAVEDHRGNLIGNGLTNYSSKDLRKISGKSSGQIADALGYCPYAEVIHRDNYCPTVAKIESN